MIRGCFGAALGLKTGENEKVLRIYGFEGETGGRGTAGHTSANQNVAGCLLYCYHHFDLPLLAQSTGVARGLSASLVAARCR